MFLTFNFSANDVDVSVIGGGGSEEADPVAVTDSSPFHLCDLVVAAEPVPDLKPNIYIHHQN